MYLEPILTLQRPLFPANVYVSLERVLLQNLDRFQRVLHGRERRSEASLQTQVSCATCRGNPRTSSFGPRAKIRYSVSDA